MAAAQHVAIPEEGWRRGEIGANKDPACPRIGAYQCVGATGFRRLPLVKIPDLAMKMAVVGGATPGVINCLAVTVGSRFKSEGVHH